MTSPNLISTAEAAQRLGLTAHKLNRYVRLNRGPVPVVQGGRGRYCGHKFNPDDVAAWGATRTTKSETENPATTA